jgi:hypothetical protein
MSIEKILNLMSQYPKIEDLKEQVSLDDTYMYD